MSRMRAHPGRLRSGSLRDVTPERPPITVPRASHGASSYPSVALALGGGGARGLAHIVVLETLDEMGIRPVLISGTSMGGIIGAAYAAGISGAEIRKHVLSLVRDRSDVMARLLKARVGRFADLLAGRMSNPVLLDGEIFLDHFWPRAVPNRFEDLQTPFIAVATDFMGRQQAAISTGPLAPAVAGSMAIPGLIKPVEFDGMILVDGGAVNPLPFDHLMGKAEIVIAVDVTGGPVADSIQVPKPFEAMFGSAQIMMGAITNQMLRVSSPDILIRPPVDQFRVLDFFKASQILEAAAPTAVQIRKALELRLTKA
ncbi:MAG: patatin-like phospholipase family protein [Hyphomicrobiales bacterium]|nr:patatin-like phospholipase family protein [Hyphomicrobiales bacterium]MDE2114933.1 patatin-like phospholipase family protein [Hyphomicrobiales bacterium]